MRTEEKFLKTEEAAEYLGFSKRTLENWRLRGGGPKFHRSPQNHVRYRQSDLDAWIAGEDETTLSEVIW